MVGVLASPSGVSEDGTPTCEMKKTDRSPSTRRGRVVWAGLAVACLVMVLVARSGQERALSDAFDASADRALAYANSVVAPRVLAEKTSPIVGVHFRELYTVARAEVFTDPTVARLRVWGADGLLLFSSDERKKAGVVIVSDDPGVQRAIDGEVVSQAVRLPFTWATTGAPAEETDLLQVYTPLRIADQVAPAGAVEVDFLMDQLRDEASSPWTEIQWAFGLLLLVCAGLFVRALRRPAVPRTVASEPSADGDAHGASEDGSADLTGVVEGLRAETTSLREEVDVAHEQLMQAEEAYRFIETRLKDSQSRLAELEGHDEGRHDGLAAELQAAASAAEERRLLAEARARDAEARAEQAVAALSAARKGEVASRHAADAPAAASPPDPAPDPVPPISQPAAPEPDPVEEPGPTLSAEATQLRERLARTAARKRHGIEADQDAE